MFEKYDGSGEFNRQNKIILPLDSLTSVDTKALEKMMQVKGANALIGCGLCVQINGLSRVNCPNSRTAWDNDHIRAGAGAGGGGGDKRKTNVNWRTWVDGHGAEEQQSAVSVCKCVRRSCLR